VIVVPAQARTHTPCLIDMLRRMGPGPRANALGRDDKCNARFAPLNVCALPGGLTVRLGLSVLNR